jgi:hypothetical protein
MARGPRSTSHFSCGHPRTPANSRVARGRGYSWTKCRTCDNNYMRAYMRRRARLRLMARIARLSQAAARTEQARGKVPEA